MADINDIAISMRASEIADAILETRNFRSKADVLMYAAGYMIGKCKQFDPSAYQMRDVRGSNYSFSTFDPNGKWAKLIKLIYPGTDTPYIYLRALMDAGLLKIDEELEGNFTKIFSLMK